MRRVWLALFFLIAIPGSAAAQRINYCSGNWEMVPGANEHGGMTKRDEICLMVFGNGRQNKRVTGYRLLSRPLHGVLGKAGRDANGVYWIGYQPAAGYTGPDTFEVEFCYVQRGANAQCEVTAQVRMNMVIMPP